MAMNPAANKADAALQARIAYELRARRAQEQLARLRRETAARLARERGRNVFRAIACSAILGVILVLGIFAGWMPMPERSLMGARAGKADPFFQTRTGQVVIVSRDGQNCRRLAFNNTTGEIGGEKIAPCEDTAAAKAAPTPADSSAAERMNSMRDAFVKR